MKKKLVVAFIASVLVFSTMGCGATTETPKEEIQEAVEEITAETTAEATTAEVTKNAVEEAAQAPAEVENDAETSEEASAEQETSEEPKTVEDIPAKYGLEITHLNGASYEDTFLMGEFNKDEEEKVIMDDYVLFEAPSTACISEVDNGDGTKTIEAYIEVVYKDWSTDYYYNHYDYVLIDLITGDILTSADSYINFEDEVVLVDGEYVNEYNDDYTFGSIRLTAVVPEGYSNYALYMRDVEKRDHMLNSFFQFENVSADNHYVLLQN